MAYGDGGKGGDQNQNGSAGSDGIIIFRYLTPPTIVPVTRTLDYWIKKTNTTTRTLDYTVRTVQQKTRSLDYTVKNITTLSRELGYQVKGAQVTKYSRALDYLVKNVIPITRSLDYTVVNRTALDRSLDYTVRYINPLTRSLSYQISNAHQLTFNFSYTVQSYIHPPYNCFNRCGFNRSYFNRWGAESIRTAQYELGYWIKNGAIQQTYDLNYDVRLPTPLSYELSYQVRVREWSTTTTGYGFGYLVLGQTLQKLGRNLSYRVGTVHSVERSLDYLVKSTKHVKNLITTEGARFNQTFFNRRGFNQEEITAVESEIYLSYMVKPITLISRSLDYLVKTTQLKSYSLGYRVVGETISTRPCIRLWCHLEYPLLEQEYCKLVYPKIVNMDCGLSKPKSVSLLCRLICG